MSIASPRPVMLAVFSMALLLLSGATAVGAAPAPPGAGYTITDLGQPPIEGVMNTILVSGINAHEQIVGSMTGGGGTFGDHYGFRWQAATGLEVLPGLQTAVRSMAARAINDRGQVVGASIGEPFTAYGPTISALLWQPDGTVQQLSAPSAGQSNSTGINNLGEVVGIEGGRAFLWDARHGLREIGDFLPAAINNRGTIAGSTRQGHAMTWDRQHGVRDLGTLPGTLQSSATSINDRGQVVGRTYANGGVPGRAFIWDEQLGMRALDLIADSTSNAATGINASGRVVGTASGHAFTWQAGVGPQELPSLPDVDAAHGMYDIGVSAGAINNQGEIAGVVSWTLAANRATVYNHLVLWRPAGV